MKNSQKLLIASLLIIGTAGCGSSASSGGESQSGSSSAPDPILASCSAKWNPHLQPNYPVATPVMVFKWASGECGTEVILNGSFDDSMSLMAYRSGYYQAAAVGISPSELGALAKQGVSEANATIGSDGSIVPDDGASIAHVSLSAN